MPNKIAVSRLWNAQMGAAVAKQQEIVGDAYSTDLSIAEMREVYRRERRFWNEGGPRPAETRETRISTPHGDVAVRMHRPTAGEVLACIVYIHGGGWVLGDLDTHDRITRILAERCGAAVIAIDYTLSPEARYPQAVEECVAVVQHLRAHASEWGIDPGDISLAGDSGGANLCCGTYLHLRDEENAAAGIRALLLFYGAYGLTDSRSMRLLGGPWDGMTESDYAWYLDLYLRDRDDLSAPYFNILGNDLSRGMPPSFILSAEFDPLKDDSATLAAMLESSGHRYELVEVPGVIHGFLHHSRMVDAAVDALDEAARFYRSRRESTHG